jgi:hypothetical protein
MRFTSPAMCRWLPALLVLSLATCFPGGETLGAGRKKRDPSIFVRFHVEVTQADPTFATKVTAGNPPREVLVEKLPSISERDISSFYPYQAADGTYSAVFQLDEHGRVTLETLSEESRGKSLLAAVNGRAVALMTIDKPVNDGIIFIPRGLTEAEIRQLGESYDIMGKDYNPKKTKQLPPKEDRKDDVLTPQPTV